MDYIMGNTSTINSSSRPFSVEKNFENFLEQHMKLYEDDHDVVSQNVSQDVVSSDDPPLSTILRQFFEDDRTKEKSSASRESR